MQIEVCIETSHGSSMLTKGIPNCVCLLKPKVSSSLHSLQIFSSFGTFEIDNVE